MKIFLLAITAIVVSSCKPTYSYESQQRSGDPYHVEWITDDGTVATCFVIESSSATFTTSMDGIEINGFRFVPDGSVLHISDPAGSGKETPKITEFIYFCSATEYKKIKRTPEISALIKEDYRVMDYKLIDHLQSKGLIPSNKKSIKAEMATPRKPSD